MLFIRELKQKLNKQSDSIGASYLKNYVIFKYLLSFLSRLRFFYHSPVILLYCFYVLNISGCLINISWPFQKLYEKAHAIFFISELENDYRTGRNAVLF